MDKRRRSTASDRVRLNVGGEIFETTVSTLVANGSFFARMWASEWRESSEIGLNPGEAELFLDRDPDSFRLLLSCMRARKAVLPSSDRELCCRMLRDAECASCHPCMRATHLDPSARDANTRRLRRGLAALGGEGQGASAPLQPDAGAHRVGVLV